MQAVITGATSGIGYEMALYLSELGWDLILTGRNSEKLRQMQQQLPTRVQWIALDLAKPDAPFALYRFCKGKRVDLLVNNAGFGLFGNLWETDLQEELELLDVNIRALHILTKLFVKEFRRRNSGILLNVASSAGFLTGPLMASYYASKNYVVRLSLALAEELRRAGSSVSVSVLCPGPVDTNFNNRSIAWLLKNYNRIYDDPDLSLDLYTRQCSLGVTALQLSIAAGTIANGGVNPVTKKEVFDAVLAPKITAMIAAVGFYEHTGDWMYTSGIPAKTGVGGGVMGVLPGQFGIAAFAPPLDGSGNSVKAQLAIQYIMNKLELNVFSNNHITVVD